MYPLNLFRTFIQIIGLWFVLLLIGPQEAAAQFTGCTNPGDQTDMPEAECDALVALYNSTNGAGWNTNTGWLATNTPCSWFGVTCFNTANVTRILFPGNNLSGSIPAALEDLTELTELNLQSNALTGAVPPELGNLPKLEKLDLFNNMLTGSIPAALGSLSTLKELKLGINQFNAIPAALENLGNLEQFSANVNQITTIPPELGNLPSLTRLDLAGNQITMIPVELANLSNLQFLTLNGNPISSIPPVLGNLANLQWLRLASGQLTSIPPELGNLSSLTRLDLSRNQFTSGMPSELGNLSNLTFLSFYLSQLPGTIPPELGNLTNLDELNLANNQLTGPIPPQLGNMTNLRILALNQNPLGGMIPPELGNLSNLQYFNLYSDQLTGTIPASLGNLTNLQGFQLFSNQLGGTVPLPVAQIGAATGNCSFTNNDPSLCMPDTPDYQAIADINNMICGLPLEPTCTPLPVELVDFRALVHQRTVELIWETATELNNAGFYIEQQVYNAGRDNDTWSVRAFVEGAGTTTESQTYSYRLEDLEPGVHRFRLNQIDFDGTSSYSSTVEVQLKLPGVYLLGKAYPNPFNPQTTFTLVVGQRQHVQIEVFDTRGRLVETLHDGSLSAGTVHRFSMGQPGWPSGLYVYHIRGENFQESRTALLVK